MSSANKRKQSWKCQIHTPTPPKKKKEYKGARVRASIYMGVANNGFDQSFWYSQCRLEAPSHRLHR